MASRLRDKVGKPCHAEFVEEAAQVEGPADAWLSPRGAGGACAPAALPSSTALQRKPVSAPERPPPTSTGASLEATSRRAHGDAAGHAASSGSKSGSRPHRTNSAAPASQSKSPAFSSVSSRSMASARSIGGRSTISSHAGSGKAAARAGAGAGAGPVGGSPSVVRPTPVKRSLLPHLGGSPSARVAASVAEGKDKAKPRSSKRMAGGGRALAHDSPSLATAVAAGGGVAVRSGSGGVPAAPQVSPDKAGAKAVVVMHTAVTNAQLQSIVPPEPSPANGDSASSASTAPTDAGLDGEPCAGGAPVAAPVAMVKHSPVREARPGVKPDPEDLDARASAEWVASLRAPVVTPPRVSSHGRPSQALSSRSNSGGGAAPLAVHAPAEPSPPQQDAATGASSSTAAAVALERGEPAAAEQGGVAVATVATAAAVAAATEVPALPQREGSGEFLSPVSTAAREGSAAPSEAAWLAQQPAPTAGAAAPDVVRGSTTDEWADVEGGDALAADGQAPEEAAASAAALTPALVVEAMEVTASSPSAGRAEADAAVAAQKAPIPMQPLSPSSSPSPTPPSPSGGGIARSSTRCGCGMQCSIM